MIREFSEEKKEELYRIFDAIDDSPCGSFPEWCQSRRYEFGDWMDRLNIPSYMGSIDQYEMRILDMNASIRSQIDTVFSNVYDIDRKYGEIFRNYAEIVEEQIARIQVMTQVMSTVNGNGINSDENVSITCAVDKYINNSDDILNYFSSYDKEIQTAIQLLDKQICDRLEITDIDERRRIIQTILDEDPSVLRNLYILNIYSGADYQGLMKRTLFDIERKYRFLTEEGLMFLFEVELGDREGWENNENLRLDEDANIIAIKIHDAQDGGYTLGAGIFLSQEYPDRIELAESLGIDWDNTNEWVPIENVNKMYSYVAQEFHNKTKNVEVRTRTIFTSNQYDAVFSMLYWKPFLDETIIELIRINANQEIWIKSIKDALYEQYGDNIFEKYPGWISRIERTVELYFGGEY